MGVTQAKLKYLKFGATELDSSLIVLIEFNWKNKNRSILFIQSRVHFDASEKPGLPVDLLQAIRPDGYRWSYLSADGRGFFSAYPGGNGMMKASEQLLALNEPGGGVFLDYSAATELQQFEGATFMAARADLENFGLQRLARFENPYEKPIFGYLEKGEEARIYVNRNIRKKGRLQKAVFNLEKLKAIGSEFFVRLR